MIKRATQLPAQVSLIAFAVIKTEIFVKVNRLWTRAALKAASRPDVTVLT